MSGIFRRKPSQPSRPDSVAFHRVKAIAATTSPARTKRMCPRRKSAVPITTRVMSGSFPASKPAKNSRKRGITYVMRIVTRPIERPISTAG